MGYSEITFKPMLQPIAEKWVQNVMELFTKTGVIKTLPGEIEPLKFHWRGYNDVNVVQTKLKRHKYSLYIKIKKHVLREYSTQYIPMLISGLFSELFIQAIQTKIQDKKITEEEKMSMQTCKHSWAQTYSSVFFKNKANEQTLVHSKLCEDRDCYKWKIMAKFNKHVHGKSKWDEDEEEQLEMVHRGLYACMGCKKPLKSGS